MQHPLYKGMTYEDVYQQKTQFKAKYIEKKKWKLETIWTCTIEKQLKTNQNMADFFKDYKESLALSEPINARSALFGELILSTVQYNDVYYRWSHWR